MNVSFRPIGKRERAILESLGHEIPRSFHGYPSLWCVTIDGFPVVAFAGEQVFYQDGSDAIPDLIRAARRVASALGTLTYDDFQRIKRKGKRPQTWDEVLREWSK